MANEKEYLRDEINSYRSVQFRHFLESARKFIHFRIQIFEKPDWSLNQSI